MKRFLFFLQGFAAGYALCIAIFTHLSVAPSGMFFIGITILVILRDIEDNAH